MSDDQEDYICGKYKPQMFLSKNSFKSKTILCKDKVQRYVMKQRSKKQQTQSTKRCVARMVKLMQKKQPRLMRLFEQCEDEYQKYLVLPYLEAQNLAKYKQRTKKDLKIRDAKQIAAQILRALQEIHKHYLLHLNLRPQNVLVYSQGKQLKVVTSDFCLLTENSKQPINLKNRDHLSPEVTMQRCLTLSADVWSFGVVLCFLLTGVSIFQKPQDLQQPELTLKNLMASPNLVQMQPMDKKNVENLLGLIFKKDYSQRIQFHAIKSHDFFKQVFKADELAISKAVYTTFKLRYADDIGQQPIPNEGKGNMEESSQIRVPSTIDTRPLFERIQKQKPKVVSPQKPSGSQLPDLVDKLDSQIQIKPTAPKIPSGNPSPPIYEPLPMQNPPPPIRQYLPPPPPKPLIKQQLPPIYQPLPQPKLNQISSISQKMEQDRSSGLFFSYQKELKYFTFQREKNRFLTETSQLIEGSREYIPNYLRFCTALNLLKLYIIYSNALLASYKAKKIPPAPRDLALDWTGFFNSEFYKSQIQSLQKSIKQSKEKLGTLTNQALKYQQKIVSKIPAMAQYLNPNIDNIQGFEGLFKEGYRYSTSITYSALERSLQKERQREVWRTGSKEQMVDAIKKIRRTIIYVFICHSINRIFDPKLIPEFFKWYFDEMKPNQFQFQTFRQWLDQTQLQILQNTTKVISLKVFGKPLK